MESPVRQSVRELIADFARDSVELNDPLEIAAILVDRDVSSGEYDGCSVELEIAWVTYVSAAEAVLAS